MLIPGKNIVHKTFGKGVVIEKDKEFITVQFIADIKPKKLKYSMCKKLIIELPDEVEEKKEKYDDNDEFESVKEAKKIIADYNSNFKSVHNFVSVEDFCNSAINDVNQEIDFAKKSGGKHLKLYDGRLIESKGRKNIYVFHSEDELFYPDQTLISIAYNREYHYGEILDCNEYTVTITTDLELGDKISAIDVSVESWSLLKALNTRLEELRENYSDLVSELVCNGKKYIENKNELNVGQEMAKKMASEQPITFIWGPPGTGKTRTLANMSIYFMKKGYRVLMLSYSNVSVDGAILRLNSMHSSNVGGIVRYGYPRSKEILENYELSSYNIALSENAELLNQRKELIEERKNVVTNSPRYIEIVEELQSIKRSLINKEKEIVKQAKFVATTVSKALVDDVLYGDKYDVVIFDEASMAYIPQLVFSASLASKHFVCIGDFKQLPPIVQNTEKSNLKNDIFNYCGITEAVNNGCNHKWLCMLDTQYRMNNIIADFISKHMYNGLLQSGEKVKEKTDEIAKNFPFENKVINIAEMSGLRAPSISTREHSRVNILSAFVSAAIARKAAENNEVGIITPYRAQSKLIHAIVRDILSNNYYLNSITSATVHQFQGSEKEVIIYDSVEGYNIKKLGTLLSSNENDYANRLFNVAMTRAKGKFIGVCHSDVIIDNLHDDTNIFGKLIKDKENVNRKEGRELIKYIKNDSISFMSYEQSMDVLKEDIDNAKNEINVDIPTDNHVDKFVDVVYKCLLKAKSRGVKVKLRAASSKNLPANIKAMVSKNNKIVNPVIIIDKSIVWYGIPKVTGEAEGYMKYNPILRFKGKNTAKNLYGILDMNDNVDDIQIVDIKQESRDNFETYVLMHTSCPMCGSPMKLKKGKYGFFLGCSGYPKCKHMEPMTEELVNEYLSRNGGTGQLCTMCNSSLVARKGRFGIYAQCCGNKKHTYRLDEI